MGLKIACTLQYTLKNNVFNWHLHGSMKNLKHPWIHSIQQKVLDTLLKRIQNDFCRDGISLDFDLVVYIFS